jgi:hypothetical protein
MTSSQKGTLELTRRPEEGPFLLNGRFRSMLQVAPSLARQPYLTAAFPHSEGWKGGGIPLAIGSCPHSIATQVACLRPATAAGPSVFLHT